MIWAATGEVLRWIRWRDVQPSDSTTALRLQINTSQEGLP
jgi:hypothetical protein